MKWPWVNRELHDQVLETANALVESLKARTDRAELQLVQERARIDQLTGEILRMRREGFVPQPEPPTPEATMQLSQPVVDAIEERAFSPAIKRALRLTAERMLRDGAEEATIVKVLLDGESFDPEEELEL